MQAENSMDIKKYVDSNGKLIRNVSRVGNGGISGFYFVDVENKKIGYSTYTGKVGVLPIEDLENIDEKMELLNNGEHLSKRNRLRIEYEDYQYKSKRINSNSKSELSFSSEDLHLLTLKEILEEISETHPRIPVEINGKHLRGAWIQFANPADVLENLEKRYPAINMSEIYIISINIKEVNSPKSKYKVVIKY